MLISADLAGTAAQYGYDGHGHRLQAARAGTATRYVLDVAGAMSQVLMETASDGTAQAYYVYGNGVWLYNARGS